MDIQDGSWYDEANAVFAKVAQTHRTEIFELPSPRYVKLPTSPPRGETYTYVNLPEGHIRVLQMNEMNDQDASFTLTTQPLHDSVQRYYAISYCWGTGQKNRMIRIQGFEFWITEALYKALYAVYRHTVVEQSTLRPLLWVDAICINQQDDDEKSAQVQSMTEIFRNAYEVFLWLGPAEGSSEKVLNVLNWLEMWFWWQMTMLARKDTLTEQDRQSLVALGFRSFIHRQIDNQQESNTSAPNRPDCATAAAIPVLGDMMYRYSSERIRNGEINPEFEKTLSSVVLLLNDNNFWECFWECFLDFNSRSWFRRAWTYQEVMIAEQATVLCGDRSVGWRILWMCRRSYMPYIQTLAQKPFCTLSWTDYAKVLQQPQYDPLPSDGMMCLQALLYSSGDKEASEPKDHVYSFAGLLPVDLRVRLKVDYTSPIRTIYELATQIACQGMDGIFIWLALMERYKGHKLGREDLPSWCPDFSDPGYGLTFAHLMIENQFGDHYKLASSLIALCQPQLSFESDTVSVPGVVMGTVERATQLSEPYALLLSRELRQDLGSDHISDYIPDLISGFISDHISDHISDYMEVFEWFIALHDLLTWTTQETVEQTHHASMLGRTRHEVTKPLEIWAMEYSGLLDLFPSHERLVEELVTKLHGLKAFCEAVRDAPLDSAEYFLVRFCRDTRELELYSAMLRHITAHNTGRCWFITTAGRLGFSPVPLHSGEYICYIWGDKKYRVLSQNRDAYRTTAHIDGSNEEMVEKAIRDAGGMTTFVLR